MGFAYERSAAEIYRRSLATIRAEAELAHLPRDLEPVAVRVIHACGMIDVAADIRASPGAASVGAAALRSGATILVDAQMVAHGIIRERLPAANPVVCTLNDARTEGIATRLETTRSAAALDLWGERLAGAVVAIGVAPTALFRLLELVANGAARPSLVIGMPVGFVGAAEAKAALIASGLPHIVVRGRRGGSAMAAAAVNAMAAAAVDANPAP